MSAEARQALDFGWLHDDTEEDVVGADWHQNAIRSLSIGLKVLAGRRGWPWHIDVRDQQIRARDQEIAHLRSELERLHGSQ